MYVAGPTRVTCPSVGWFRATLASPPTMCTVISPIEAGTSPQLAAAQAAAHAPVPHA
jgi:hypothetical protein